MDPLLSGSLLGRKAGLRGWAGRATASAVVVWSAPMASLLLLSTSRVHGTAVSRARAPLSSTPPGGPAAGWPFCSLTRGRIATPRRRRRATPSLPDRFREVGLPARAPALQGTSCKEASGGFVRGRQHLPPARRPSTRPTSSAIRCAFGSARACLTPGPARGPTWPVRPSRPRTTCPSSSRPLRGPRPRALPDQPALRRPRSRLHPHGRDAEPRHRGVPRGERRPGGGAPRGRDASGRGRLA